MEFWHRLGNLYSAEPQEMMWKEKAGGFFDLVAQPWAGPVLHTRKKMTPWNRQLGGRWRLSLPICTRFTGTWTIRMKTETFKYSQLPMRVFRWEVWLTDCRAPSPHPEAGQKFNQFPEWTRFCYVTLGAFFHLPESQLPPSPNEDINDLAETVVRLERKICTE